MLSCSLSYFWVGARFFVHLQIYVHIHIQVQLQIHVEGLRLKSEVESLDSVKELEMVHW